jgi:beta-aspartyl-dipeptidase (metallo-type)
MVTLVRGGHLYGPEDLGKQDLLLINGKIERIAPEINLSRELFPDAEVIEAKGRLVFPGFIDQHMHTTGGGGSGGPLTRVKEVFFQDIVRAGITTVVGTLGTDTISKSLEGLLMKTKALNLCGLHAFLYTGSVLFPPLTLTGSVERDITLIDEILGVKTGLGEAVFPRPDLLQLENLFCEASRAGSLSGKRAVVHVHLAAEAWEWIQTAESIVEARGLPYRQLVLTHVNRSSKLLERSFQFAKKGGRIDVTTCVRPPERREAVKPSTALRKYLEDGGPLDHITFSSDSNASRVLKNGEINYTRADWLLEEFRDCVQKERIPLPQALAVVTRNAAERLGMSGRQGSLQEGFLADLAFFTESLELTDLIAGGRWLLKNKKVAEIPLE